MEHLERTAGTVSKMLEGAFEVQRSPVEDTQDADITFENIGVLLRLVEAGHATLDWERGEQY